MTENALSHMLLNPIIDRVFDYATLRARLRAIWTTQEQLNFLLQPFLTV
jgi:hypothetical protein